MDTKRLLQLLTQVALVFIVMFAFAGSAMAQSTWYVSSTSGNDALDGTSANVVSGLVGPKKTINAALAVAGDGDTIVVEAGAYAENVDPSSYAKAGGDTANLDDITFQVTAAGLLTTATVTGNLTIGTDANFNGGTGEFVFNGNFNLNARTVTIATGKLGFTGTPLVTRVAGAVAGAAPVYPSNVNVTYNAGALASITAGLELPANLGTGTLTVTQTSGTLGFPNAVTANTFAIGGGATVTFSGDVTVRNAGGGFTTAGTVTVAAGNVQLNNNVLTVVAATSFTSTGMVTSSTNAPNAAGVIQNAGTTTIANFATVVTSTNIAGYTAITFRLTNNATMSIGAVSEGTAPDTDNTPAGAIKRGEVEINNVAGTLTFTASNTLSGDVVANGGTIALGANTLTLTVVTPTAMGTFTGNTSTLVLTRAGNVPAIAAGGNVQITTSAASVIGAITSTAGSVTITGDAKSAPTWLTTTGAITATAGNITITGNTAVAGNLAAAAGTISWNGKAQNAAGNFTAAGITIGGSGTLTGNVVSTANLTVSSTADFNGTLTVSGTSTFAGGNNLNGLGAASTTGALIVNGALTTTANAGTLTVTGTTTVSQTAGSINLNGTTQFTFRGDFTGGTLTYTGVGSTVYLLTGAATMTFTPGANSMVYNLTVGGDLNRTITLAQSVQVDNMLTVEDDTNLDLTNKLVRLAGNAVVVTLNDDAQIIASGDTGALSFEFAPGGLATAAEPAAPAFYGPEIRVTGAPVVAPSVSNIIINNPHATPEPVDVDNAIRITGIVSLVNGGLELNNVTATWTGANAGVNRNVAGASTQITTVGAGAVAGTYNLTYSGATGVTVAAGSELSASVNNMTVSTTGAGAPQVNVTVAVAIQGNLTVNAGANLGLAAVLTVPGNSTVNGTVSGAFALTLTGNGATHSVVGTISAPVAYNHNATVTGSTSNTNPATITGLVTVAATRTVTMTNMQQLSAITVSGALSLGMVDAAGAGLNDAVIYGALLVNDGGSLTLTTNVTSNLTVTIGSTTAQAPASLDLGGNTLDMVAGAFVANDSAAPASANANLGTTGTVKLSVGAANFTGNGATVPSLNVAANVTVTTTVVATTLTVNEGTAGAATVTIGGTLTLAGDAALTDPNGITFAGGQFVTTGTTLTASSNVTFASLRINSSSTTTLASNNATQRTFTANVYLHSQGGVDVGAQLLVIADANPVYVNGTYAASTGYVVLNGGGNFDTTEKVISFPRLQVAGAVVIGLADGTPDGITVTGTLWFNGGSISTDSNASGGTAPNTGDATFSVADGATIYDQTAGASFTAPTAPSLGTGLTVRYGVTKTTGKELPGTVAVFRIDTGSVVTLQDTRSITTTTFDVNGTGQLVIDADAGNDGNGFNIADGGMLLISGNGGAGGGVISNTGLTAGEFAYAGAYSITFDGSATSQTNYWLGVPTIVTVNDGSSVTVATLTLGANHTTGDLTIVGNDALTLGGFTLTVNGSITNGTAIGGAGAVAFVGTTPQTVDATGGLALPGVIFNNPAGITITGGNLVVGATGATFTAGVVHTGANFIQLIHTNTFTQGFVQTAGCVNGNIRKNIVGGLILGNNAADRMNFPLCNAAGDNRSAAITFNNPQQISTGAGLFLLVGNVESSAGGANNMPLTTTDIAGGLLKIARYPAFHWVVTASASLSPSVDYDVELRAGNFAAFDGEKIENVRTIRRQAGATTNFWTLVGPTAASNDNYAITNGGVTNEPVAIVRNAVGAIIGGAGTVFTMGLESNLAASAVAAVSVNAGATDSSNDLATIVSGGTAPFTYTVASSDPAVATGAVAGSVLTVTGVAPGAATITVTVRDALNDEVPVAVAVTVNPALAASPANTAVTLNAGGTSTADLSAVFTGGAAPVTYAVTTSDAGAATGAVASGTLTVTAVAAGSAVVTVTATDATGQTATATWTTTVNAAMAAGALANVTVTEGATADTDISATFTGGTGTKTYAATSGAPTTASVAISGTTVTATGVAPYVITGGAVTADTAPATVTVTATDELSSMVTATYTVTVNPKAGNVSGAGPDPASASLTLNSFLGLNTLTAKQLVAADYDANSSVTPFDAAQIFNKWLSGKREVVANPAAVLAYGELRVDGPNAVVPVMISGEKGDVVSFQYTTFVDPSVAKVTGVTSNLEGWTIAYSAKEDGTIMIAGYGLDAVPADGQIASIHFTLTQEGTEFALEAQGAVNANSASDIGGVMVGELPENFSLLGNYPNPFNPSTTISFDLPATAEVTVQVFDMLGRQVLVLPAQTIQGGAKRSLQLNGSTLASGSYFYRVIAKMDSNTAVETGRMLLVK